MILKRIYEWIFLRMMGWEIHGSMPDLKKYIIVVAPHTSNWDFMIGVFTRKILGFNSRFVAKKELFIFPFGMFFKWMGGYPVDRKKHSNFVDMVVQIFKEEDEFIVAMTPEGTRSYNPNWKSGFYHIAKQAKVPIVTSAIDYSKKCIVFSEPFYPELSAEETIVELKKYFSQFVGKNPKDGVIWPE